MENPVAVIKKSVSIPKLIGYVTLGVIAMAFFDVGGITNWFLYPVTNIRNRFFAGK